LFKFYNGSILGGTWNNGVFDNGYLASKKYKLKWLDGIANNGIYENVMWSKGSANSGEFRNNTILSTNLTVDVIPNYLRIHLSKENIKLFDINDTIILNNIEPGFILNPIGIYNEVEFRDSFQYTSTVNNVYINELTATYYVEIPIPLWLNYANLVFYNNLCNITFAYINKGNITASINGGIISDIANNFDDVILGGNVTNVVINKCVYNNGNVTNSLIKNIYWRMGNITTSWIWNGRFNTINTNLCLINGGVIENGGNYDSTTFKYVSNLDAVGIILSSGYFTMSVADSNINWDNINYISGIFPTYSGPTVVYPGTLLTNTNVTETAWVYQPPTTTLIPQIYTIAFGNYSSNLYHNFATIMSNLYEYDKPTINEAVSIKITNSGGVFPLDTFYKFLDTTDITQINNANIALYNGSPSIGPVVSYPGNFKPAANFTASAKMKIYRNQPIITYPFGYTLTVVIRNLTTLVEFEYLSLYPAPMNITTTSPGQNFEILLKITAIGGTTNSLPSNAITTTTFTTTKNGLPYTTSPYGVGFVAPNLYGPVYYIAPQLYSVINTTTGLPVSFPGDVITDVYNINIVVNSRINPVSTVVPITVNAKFLFV
jgi:hypothetical protein